MHRRNIGRSINKGSDQALCDTALVASSKKISCLVRQRQSSHL